MDFIKKDIEINNYKFYTLSIALPKTTLLVVGNSKGFIMCGALDVSVYETPKLKIREVICANAIGVKTIEELIDGTINSCTTAASNLGIKPGMKVRDALTLLS